jgi:FtsH-binding integral membrane protein
MSQLTFTTKVMPLFGGALLVSAAGAYLGLAAGRSLGVVPLFGAVAVQLILAFTAGLWQQKEGLNRALFFLYALLSGVTLVPLLAWVGMIGGVTMIAQALTVTTVTFGGVAVYGLTTKRDLSGMGAFLFALVLGLLVAGLLNALVFHSGMLSLVTSVLGVGVFAGFVAYDMSTIRQTYSNSEYVGAALALFIDFIGLFSHILRLFGIMGSRDD